MYDIKKGFDVKLAIFVAILLVLLGFTLAYWSTIQLIFLLAVGPIFTFWGTNLREERKSYAFVASVIGFVLSLVILLNYSPALISQLKQEDAPTVEVIEEAEEDQGIFNKIFGSESEQDVPDEPSLLDQYLWLVILCNAIGMIQSVRTFVSREKTDQRIAEDFAVDNSNATQSSVLTEIPEQEKDKSDFSDFLTNVGRWFNKNE
jgi:hypothetical protein